MSSPPDAEFLVLTSRLAPHLDGGYAVAVASRLRLLHSIGVRRPLLLTFDVGDPDEREGNLRHALRDDPVADIEMRNLYDEVLDDSSWLYERAQEGEGDPAVVYRPIRDGEGREVLSLPVIRDDPRWHLTRAPVVVRGGNGSRVLAGFGALYMAWLTRVVADLRARAADDQRSVVVICESKQVGELIADWADPNVRIVHTVHNSHLAAPCRPSAPLRDDGWRRWLDLLDRFDAVVWPTPTQENDVAARFGAHEGSAVIPTPVSPDATPRAHPRRATDVLMVNRLVDQKRVDTAIALWPSVVARVPDAQLHIYGDGPLRQALHDLIEERGVRRSVHLHGYSDRVRDAMAVSAVFLCTSTFEGQNLAIGEALASGLPVVAFDVCYGPRDYIGDGGVLIAPGDTDGVASALTALLTDESVRDEMSERAREQSLRLTPDAVGETFARLLEDVVARPARR